MTQEEKAKRYDEALEELRGLLEGIHEQKCEILEEDIINIFPELKENEDERIRKWLEEHIEAMPDNSIEFKDVKRIDVLHWLEKQGEQKPVISDDALREGIGHFGITQYQITNWLKKYVDVEKQGEQKQDPCDNCKNVMLNCHNFPCIKKRAFKQGKSVFDAINEEKVDNANKAETKFKVGDFVVIQETTYLISKIEGLNVTLSLNGREGIFDIDVLRNAHLYTIEDAKDGDVIYSRHNTESFEWMGIFKSLDKENKGVHFYGFWNNLTNTFKVCGNELFVSYDDFSPATKEQCEQLEKTMADAGYTFDFEKKELKKIEDEIEIPFGAKDSELMEESYNIPKGFHAEIDGDKVVIKKGEKPTAWSEEYIADVFEKVGLAKIVREQSNDALTIALQDAMIELSKVTLQQKPAWSEEDEYWSERLLGWLNTLINYIHYDSMVSLDLRRERIQQVEQIKTWLNSIKDRVGCEANCTTTKKWKPSDEQMDALQYVCRNLNPPLSDKLGWDSLKTLELLYKILKKLY